MEVAGCSYHGLRTLILGATNRVAQLGLGLGNLTLDIGFRDVVAVDRRGDLSLDAVLVATAEGLGHGRGELAAVLCQGRAAFLLKLVVGGLRVTNQGERQDSSHCYT